MPPTRKARKENSNSQNLQKKIKRNEQKMFQYAPEQLERALEEIKEKRMGIRKASRQCGIPKTPIIDRLKGRVLVTRRKIGPDPILLVEVERKIVEWIIKIAKCGFPLKKADLLNTVQKIAQETDKTKFFKDGRPGQKWYKQFLKRHSELSFREAEGINKARAIITEEYIRAWFHELQIFLTQNNLTKLLDDPSCVFNGDESGFSLCPKSGKVLDPKGWKNLYQIKLGNEKGCLTVLIVFSANGVVCPPLVVFPYIRPP
ncbi:hypothetical protein NQ314_013393 [Rhamnusium bicolor]|uniref:HTH CENPB-type domain-containing protein n=1 Tax=Rhamnusium bicolor TaxID=1586634 RepID=A0AAV8X6D9_9CUCU|nr:hypothetical protein NQ314_013393 [Rhamnusium bicolor]